MSICQKHGLDLTILLSFVLETQLKFLKDLCTERRDFGVMPHKKKNKFYSEEEHTSKMFDVYL